MGINLVMAASEVGAVLLAAMLNQGFPNLADQARALIDQAGIDLDQVGTGIKFGDRISTRGNTADADERDLAGQFAV